MLGHTMVQLLLRESLAYPKMSVLILVLEQLFSDIGTNSRHVSFIDDIRKSLECEFVRAKLIGTISSKTQDRVVVGPSSRRETCKTYNVDHGVVRGLLSTTRRAG